MDKAWWARLDTEREQEIAWEREMAALGADLFEKNRYRRNGDRKEVSELPTGMKHIRRLLPKLEKTITDVKKEYLTRSRTSSDVKAAVILIPTHTVALFTLTLCIDETYRRVQMGQTIMNLSVMLGKIIETELNFLHWIQTSKEAAREYARANGRNSAVSQAERLMKEHGVSASSLRRWKTYFEELNEYQWDDETRVHVGEVFITAVYETFDDLFECKWIAIRDKKSKRLFMKDKLRHMLDTSDIKLSRMKYVKKPMITRPAPWVLD